MKIGFDVGDRPEEEQLRFAKQMGADGITCEAQVIPGYNDRGYPTVDELAELKRNIESQGLEFFVLRIPHTGTAAVLSGKPERDQEIEGISATIRTVGKVGVPIVFYNLTPWRSLGTWWPDLPGVPIARPEDLFGGSGPGRYYRGIGRGGAVLLTHSSARAKKDASRAPSEVVAPYGEISAEEMWERIRYLYERIVPVAEESGVHVCAHPDDPPEPYYRGVEQVLNSVAGLKRLVDLVPSPNSGLLLCLGTLSEMGEDTLGAIEYFLEKNKIFGVHFRNPRGTVTQGSYQEDFLDTGDLDMLEVMRLFFRYGYRGFFDPDHAVGVIEDDTERIGFAWELGYMKALKAAVESECESGSPKGRAV